LLQCNIVNLWMLINCCVWHIEVEIHGLRERLAREFSDFRILAQSRFTLSIPSTWRRGSVRYRVSLSTPKVDQFEDKIVVWLTVAQRWDESMANEAQKWTSRCLFMHDGMNAHGQSGYIRSTKSLNITHCMYTWYDEKPHYNYDNNSCSTVTCRHYKQVSLRPIYLLYIGKKAACSLYPIDALKQQN